jgi:hypothetical protein
MPHRPRIRDDLRSVESDAAKRAGRVHLGLQYTPPSPAWDDVQTIVGTWLSLVERTLGVGEVASSNLVVPTIFLANLILASRFR